jgi:hypothetical protein
VSTKTLAKKKINKNIHDRKKVNVLQFGKEQTKLDNLEKSKVKGKIYM